METVQSMENADQKRPGILYPVMLIAAIVLIVFSVFGIATMMGWMPAALSGSVPGAKPATAPAAAPAGKAAASRPHMPASTLASCHDCGVIESIRAGAYAGHEIEKNVKKSVSYQVRVRMNDGTYRTFNERTQPALAIGQKVRVTEQGVIAAGWNLSQ